MRIEITEKPKQARKGVEILPKNIEEVKRIRVKPEGSEESEFLQGSKQVI